MPKSRSKIMKKVMGKEPPAPPSSTRRRGRKTTKSGEEDPAAGQGGSPAASGEYSVSACGHGDASWPTVVDAVVREHHVASKSVDLSPVGQLIDPPDTFDALPQALSCVGDELGSVVPMSVKEKIWKGEFLDLGILLKSDVGSLSEEASFSLVQAGGSLQVRSASRTPQIANIDMWTSAFLTYASVYVEKHGNRARELFKYMDTVRSIVRFGGYNWRTYDVQFRLRQARQPLRSWATIDTELWLTVATAQPRAAFRSYTPLQPFRAGAGSGAATSYLRGRRGGPSSPPRDRRAGADFARGRANHCFAFNAGSCKRAICRFAHVCANCGSSTHAAQACTRGAVNGTQKDSRPIPN
ncbi:uncharacterized protein [Diadema antillarum]|uniref:uncharacterized protein isoform X2 n=1 Tax=Diadema antillarum TaxID=105358 RepID=UPI003A87B1E8